MESVSADDDNNMKWSAIPLTLQVFLNKRSNYLETINNTIFNTPLEASQKFDGTNVGKDTNGLMYGRNKMIPGTTNSYQKTKIDELKAMDINPLVSEITEVTGVTLKNFVLYGELMCNAGLYDYKKYEKFNVFGAMIRPEEGQSAEDMVQQLAAKGFAAQIRGGSESGEEDEEPKDVKIMLMMN